MAAESSRRRGRPKGYQVSDETRRKISEARSKIELAKRRAKKALPPVLCDSCRESGPKVRAYVWNPDETDPKALDSNMLCSFCLSNAPLVGKKGLGL